MTVDDIRRLREKTGYGWMDCKEALEAMADDFDKAVELLPALRRKRAWTPIQRNMPI